MTVRQLTQRLKQVRKELEASKARSSELGEALDEHTNKITELEEEYEQRERELLDEQQAKQNRIEELESILNELCVCEAGESCKACENSAHLDQKEPTFSFRWYQREAYRTAGHDSHSEGLCAVGLGVAGEAGEVADYLKKVLLHGHTLDKDKLVKELGDVMWYIALAASIIDVPLSEIASRNIEKLRKRYPDGFSPQASINRPEE